MNLDNKRPFDPFEKHYEYIVAPAGDIGMTVLTDYLNKMHKEGWRLCAANNYNLFFERDIR